MSYILEALKKAQAERQLGSTPGIHDAPALMPAAQIAPGRDAAHSQQQRAAAVAQSRQLQ